MGAWYIRIIGKRRKDVDLNLIVQAVIALGEQLRQAEAAEELPLAPPAIEQRSSETEASS